ncbi:tetratricopeptide repeat protein 16 isoform X2 [Trichomycterus rosablanca]|uniref:tetratricopeptide repeat protein 16 isoform X2 n=1 Tax=Trichomycterus rosablanca TaxID=2290929 RepID=UPI002F358AA8
MNMNKTNSSEVVGSTESERKITSSREAAPQKLFDSSSVFQTSEFKLDRSNLCSDVIVKNKANTHYQVGIESMGQSQYERAVTCFTKAIMLQPKQTQLYLERAEAYIQLCDFKSAALDYKHVCNMEPQITAYLHRLAFIYYLQGQCCFDQGMFLEALTSFTKAAELRPNFQPYHMRRLACLSALGRYIDCICLATNWIEKGTPSSDLFTFRARSYHQLNQAALKLNPNCPEAQTLLMKLEQVAQSCRQQAVTKAVAGELSDSLSKITTALEHNPEKAQYYLFRGILYRRLKDFTAAIEDLVLAVEFSNTEPKHPKGQKPEDFEDVEKDANTQLVLTYNDFAVHCFSQGFYSEAITLLTKAINKQRDESGLFINRGDCFFKQKELRFALADYQQADELDPQNTTIWLRLAVAHNKLGLHSYNNLHFQEAAERFSAAIKYNPGEAQYYGNRARANSRTHNMEEANRDAIRALVLDPTNDELVALVLQLFPGCFPSDVLSSGTAQMLKAQLMEQIQNWKLVGSPQSSLSNNFARMDIRHDSHSQSETDSKSPTSVKDVKIKSKKSVSSKDTVVSKEKVTSTVKKLLHKRESLSYTGPRLAPLCPPEKMKSVAGSTERPYSWKNFKGLGLNC